MVTTDFPKKSLHIKEDNKFFSRFLLKDTSATMGISDNTHNSSFRVYYGGASGAVPFTWEVQPGTPKNPICDDYNLPPLTPPPAYYSTSMKITGKKASKPSLFRALFPKRHLRRTHSASSSSSFSSFLSPSSSSASSPRTNTPTNFIRLSRFSSSGSSFEYKVGDDEHSTVDAPTNNACFAVVRRESRSAKVRGVGCYPWLL